MVILMWLMWLLADGPEVLFRLPQRLRSGQTIASSNGVTRHTSYCWEYTKMGLNSGFGIIAISICPSYSRD